VIVSTQTASNMKCPRVKLLYSNSLINLRFLTLLCMLFCAQTVQAQDASRFRSWSGPTPSLVLNDLNGKTRDLNDYRGKVVIVNFMATWCGPCIEEMPSLQSLRERFRGRGLEVIAVSTGEAESKVSKFVRDLRIEFPVLVDPDEVSKDAWKIRGIPASFIVDSSGKIIYRILGEIDWLDEEPIALIESMLPAEQKSISAALE
jgi:peroxiredoxin